MTFCRSALATLTVCALALAGCDKNSAPKAPGSHEGAVGSIAARLTLPDNSQIDSVHYHITGPGMYSLDGDVPVGDSTILTFRIGGIPVANGYTIALNADTSYGNTCMGSSPFDIIDNQVSSVSVVLICGAGDTVGDLIVNGEVQSCPVVTAISAIPAEITLTHSMSLSAQISHGTNPVHWSGGAANGTFGSPDAYATTFTCANPGTVTLTVAVNTTDCHDARTVDVTCTLGAGCGNGATDPGEQCDDGNTVNTDACTNSCHNAVCGDGFIEAGVETCDDSNSVGGDGCSATCQSESCGNGVTEGAEQCDDGNAVNTDACTNTCHLAACGDGFVGPGETCDDSNAVTEACTYGQTSCTVCNSTCQSVAGATAYCGDGTVNGGEVCDDGNTVDNDACSNTCTGNDLCSSCREANCHTYFSGSMDAVAGCFDSGSAGATARSSWTSSVFTPTDVQHCVDLIGCAETSNCGHDSGRPLAACYCGTNFPNNGDCAAATQATAATTPNGVCKAAVEAAAGDTAPANVMTALSSTDVPAGWAYFLLECETNFCATQCSDM